MVKLPGVFPLADDTVSQVWFEATVYAITLPLVPLLVTLTALLVPPAATGAHEVELTASIVVGVVPPLTEINSE
jgi:hypothetical protein